MLGARPGQQIDIAFPLAKPLDEIAADKAGTAGDEICHAKVLFIAFTGSSWAIAGRAGR